MMRAFLSYKPGDVLSQPDNLVVLGTFVSFNKMMEIPFLFALEQRDVPAYWDLLAERAPRRNAERFMMDMSIQFRECVLPFDAEFVQKSGHQPLENFPKASKSIAIGDLFSIKDHVYCLTGLYAGFNDAGKRTVMACSAINSGNGLSTESYKSFDVEELLSPQSPAKRVGNVLRFSSLP